MTRTVFLRDFKSNFKEKIFRSEKHKAFVRQHPCIVSGCNTGMVIQACHIGRKNYRRKCDDRYTVPGCAEHHQFIDLHRLKDLNLTEADLWKRACELTCESIDKGILP